MESYRRYGPAVLRKCERMLGNRADAEDVVQSLFTELLRKGMSDVDLPYLYRAATNRCLNLIRDSRRRQELLQRRAAESRGPVRTLLDERAVDVDLLSRLVDRLDDSTSGILVHRYVDDMSQEEISQVTGLSRKTVGKRLQTIREQALKLAVNGNGGLGC